MPEERILPDLGEFDWEGGGLPTVPVGSGLPVVAAVVTSTSTIGSVTVTMVPSNSVSSASTVVCSTGTTCELSGSSAPLLVSTPDSADASGGGGIVGGGDVIDPVRVMRFVVY